MGEDKSKEKLKKLCEKGQDFSLYTDFENINEIIKNLNVIVQNDIDRVNRNLDEDGLKRIETYMPLLQEWMLKLKDRKEFIVQKICAKAIFESNQKLQKAFSEEGMKEYQENLQKKIDEKSKEYARM